MWEVIKKFLDYLQEFVLTPAIVVILIWLFVLGLRKVDGISMYPYLHDKDIIGLYKLQYVYSKPKRGDVVVFRHTNTQYYVKRVIGLPGETIMVSGGKVYINGKQLDESEYLDSSVYTIPGNFLAEGVPYTIPDGQYFCMGDNRQNSTDSRDFGPVSLDLIKGRVVFVLYPFDHIKWVKRVDYSSLDGGISLDMLY